MLLYQIYPRSFRDADGDGLGDLRGVTEKLPYVKSLGVDAVWLSPFVQSPQKDFGYDVSDYCAVDPRFGTLDDFKKLLAAAHKLNLKVLMDQVWCHCSDAHAWFKESRKDKANKKADWFIWADARPDGTPPNNWLSYFGGPAWHWDSTRQQYYFHQFLASQPTFNLRNKAVRKALLEAGRFWLELGVDGFRLDAIHTGFADPALRHNPPRPKTLPTAPDVPATIPQARQIRSHSEGHNDTLIFLKEIRALANHYNAVLLGEVNGENPYARAALYTSGTKYLHTAYSFGLLKDKPDAKLFASTVLEAQKHDGHYCYALSNHDVTRVASRWQNPKLALLFGLSLPGDYCLYQGEELGLPEADVPFEKMVDPFGLAFYPAFKGRDGCRTPMPWQRFARHGGFSMARHTWLPFSDAHKALAVDVQERDKNSMLTFSRKALAWRKAEPALHGTGFKFLPQKNGLIAFERFHGPARLACFFNLSNKSAHITKSKDATRLEWQSLGASEQKSKVILPPDSCAFFKI